MKISIQSFTTQAGGILIIQRPHLFLAFIKGVVVYDPEEVLAPATALEIYLSDSQLMKPELINPIDYRDAGTKYTLLAPGGSGPIDAAIVLVLKENQQ